MKYLFPLHSKSSHILDFHNQELLHGIDHTGQCEKKENLKKQLFTCEENNFP